MVIKKEEDRLIIGVDVTKINVRNHDGTVPYNSEKNRKYFIRHLSDGIRRCFKAGKPIDSYKKYANEAQVQEARNKETSMVEKLNDSIAVFVPTHKGHLPWLRACLESCRKLGYFILLGYDNPFWRSKTLDNILPPPDVLSLADSVVFKHRSYHPSVGIPHLWNMVYGLKLLKGFGFKYVYNINGDCIMEKPEGFPEILEMLGNNDIISNHWEPERRYAGTMGFVSKIDLAEKVFVKYAEDMHMGLGTTEGRLAKYILENDVKITPVKSPVHDRYKLPWPEGDWYRILGFRHLHAEHKVRQANHLEPVEAEYMELGPNNSYVGKFYMDTVYKYQQTGDKQFLEKWWNKGGRRYGK